MSDSMQGAKLLRFPASLKNCRSFAQLAALCKTKYGIILHAENPTAVTRFLAKQVHPSSPQRHFFLEGKKHRFDKKKTVLQRSDPALVMPDYGVYCTVEGDSGGANPRDRVFSPRKKYAGSSVEAAWGLTKQYRDKELTAEVFCQLQQDNAGACELAVRRAPALAKYRQEFGAYPAETRFVSMDMRVHAADAPLDALGDPFGTSSKPVARRFIYSRLVQNQMQTMAAERMDEYRGLIDECPLPLMVTGRDYDGPKTIAEDGTIIHESLRVDRALLEERVRDKVSSFGHMYVYMAELAGELGGFTSTPLKSGRVVRDAVYLARAV